MKGFKMFSNLTPNFTNFISLNYKRYKFKTIFIAFIYLLVCNLGFADDTDVYLNPSVPSGAEPLVMFSLDYRSNLGATACNGTECDTLIAEGYLPPTGPYTFYDVLQGVFKKVFEPLTGVRVGFMINHDHINNCEGPSQTGCSNGGYILSGFTPFDSSDSNGAKSALHTKLAAIPTPSGNVAHSYQGKELFFEFFRYLTGQDVYNAHNGWTDYGTNNIDNLPTDNPSISWDTSIENGTTYISPLANVLACSKIFTINLMFQVSNQEDDSDSAITESTANGGLGGINLSGTNNRFETVIRYLRDADLGDGSFGTVPDIAGLQNVISYFIVDPTKINQTTNGYANAGGTGNALALSSDPDELIATLNNIFKSILSVSTTFVAPAVPVNVFNRAETANEVFLALFLPEENGFPQWKGNIKKLTIGENSLTGKRELQDVTGMNAIDVDGRIRHDALTYWTNAVTLPPPVDNEVAGKDGRSVGRGGAGQKIPGIDSGNPGQTNSSTGARQLFVEDVTDLTDGLMELNADATTAANLWTELTANWNPAASSTTYSGATTAEQQKALNILRFVRGLEDDGTTVRSWLLGDPLHSRPEPINYGARSGFSATNPDIRILAGTNDGFLHMFKNTTSGGAQDGSETWAIMPREVLDVMDRLHSNTAGTPVHPITVDGNITTYRLDVNQDGTLDHTDGDKVYAYFGLRRGGKSYYALDISDPDAPEFLWSIMKGASGTDFAELAQSWSTPQLGRVTVGTNVLPVLIFGGGYNGDDDGDNQGDLGKDESNRVTPQPVGTNDDEGNAIFIVNALTGDLIWKTVKGGSQGYNSSTKSYSHPDLNDSIAADIAAIDTNGNGITDRIYAGDTGGAVWRVDLVGSNFDATDPSLWQVNKVLSVGRHLTGNNDTTNDRRFINLPDIIQSRDSIGPFDGIIIGSGDRENPNASATENWFYMFKDRAINSGAPSTTLYEPSDLADLTSNCLQNDSCSTQPDLTNGWRIQLTISGEKNVSPAVTAGGTIFFTTFVPSVGLACALNDGEGYLYAVDVQNATAKINFNTTNDLPGIETLERSGKLVAGGLPTQPVIIGNGYILVQGRGPTDNIMKTEGKNSFKTYWHEYTN